jgi:hypothetical protein
MAKQCSDVGDGEEPTAQPDQAERNAKFRHKGLGSAR